MERGTPSQVKTEFIRYLLDLLEREGFDVTFYDEPTNAQIVFPLEGSLWRLRASAIEPYRKGGGVEGAIVPRIFNAGVHGPLSR